MNKLRKIRVWVWRNKELLFLVLLVILLCSQVYDLLFPEKHEAVRATSPRKQPGEGAALMPPVPPEVPGKAGAAMVESLVRNNPFTIYGGAAPTPSANQRQEITASSLGLRLNRILPWREGTYQAEIVLGRSRGRYQEGDSFGRGAFRVDRIDNDRQQVDVWVAQYKRTFTLEIGQ